MAFSSLPANLQLCIMAEVIYHQSNAYKMQRKKLQTNIVEYEAVIPPILATVLQILSPALLVEVG